MSTGALLQAAAGPGLPARIVANLLGLYALAIFVMSIMSWFQIREGSGAWPTYRFLMRITDPIILPIRRAMPSMNSFDVTPVVVIFAILMLRNLILS